MCAKSSRPGSQATAPGAPRHRLRWRGVSVPRAGRSESHGMPRVVWTEEAEEQLTAIPSDETVEELLALAAGLARFPRRGRYVPELQDHPEYEIVREVILPRKARVFYLFVPDSDEVIILGLLPRGGAFRSRVLGPRFEQD
ncbi:MAG: hypothetical protein DMF66_07490 [Acidobacteria bacterium]|nr:MAG: hypothetical protein DMF66_07490 [Acidobacteriota bacterium]